MDAALTTRLREYEAENLKLKVALQCMQRYLIYVDLLVSRILVAFVLIQSLLIMIGKWTTSAISDLVVMIATAKPRKYHEQDRIRCHQ